eukprot:2224777-Rhodomonas_salina.1
MSKVKMLYSPIATLPSLLSALLPFPLFSSRLLTEAKTTRGQCVGELGHASFSLSFCSSSLLSPLCLLRLGTACGRTVCEGALARLSLSLFLSQCFLSSRFSLSSPHGGADSAWSDGVWVSSGT